MALAEKITQEDIILYEILKHPVLCPEFIYNIDLDPQYDTNFSFVQYQKEIMCDFHPYVSMATARAVGKTVSQYSLLMWALIFKVFPDDYLLYTVPSKVHLEPVFTNLVRLFRTNSFLKNFIDTKSGVNSSEFKVTLKTGATLLCRIAGQSGTGANLIGLHTPWIEVDEAGYFPLQAFNEMQPSLNTWTPGFRQIVSGVPTGMRENNVLYQVDMESESFTKHRISAYDNPRISEADIAKAIDQYGGQESEDFVHYVLGQHGKPVFALFDRALLKIGDYPVYKVIIDGIKTEDLGEMLLKLDALPSAPDDHYGIVFGVDLGYTEPTAISIMYVDSKDRLKFHARIRLNKVSYPMQEKLLDHLDSRFKPIIIGIDRGNIGIPFIQNLQEHTDYIHKNYRERLYPIEFSSWVSLGLNQDGEENKVKAKPFFVSILQEMSNNHRVIYSSTDMDMIVELERMTYTRNPSGDIVYKTLTDRGGKRGDDHFTSSVLCGVGAFHMTREFSQLQPKIKLIKAVWI